MIISIIIAIIIIITTVCHLLNVQKFWHRQELLHIN